MTIYEASYLLRYVFVVLVVIIALRLLLSSIRDLNWGIKHSLRPAQGYFLLSNQGDGETMSLPLYHTTNIGRAASNDIRIYSDLVRRRHALIYRFDGDWYVRPASKQSDVVLNNQKVEEPAQLKNGDTVNFGPSSFVFVDERSIAKERGETYEEAIFDDDAFYRAAARNSRPPYFAWVLLNLFTLLTTFLVFKMMPGVRAVKKDFLLYTAVAVLLLDLYFLLLPLILRYADRILYLTAAQLTVIGLAIQSRLALVGSRAFRVAAEQNDQAEMLKVASGLFRAYRTQLLALLIGLGLLWIVLLITSRTRFLEGITVLSGVITPALLLITLIFGRGASTHGAGLWINLGGYSLQLTEFAKITYLITMASFFKHRPPLRTQIYFAVWAGVNFVLLLLLPDLGSIMILLPVTLLVFVVMTSEYLKAFLIFVSSSVLAVLAYVIFPHVRRRLSGWTSLWDEVNDQNRQVVYGLQAIGRGNVTGRGLGNGSPGGIPLAKSDMIFDILCEEFGVIFGICVIIFIVVILLRAIRTTILARDGFSSSLALGLGATLFCEAFVVIGGTTGLIPLTGVTLPFIAQGGSSLLAKWLIIGLLLGLASRHEEGANRK